MKAFAAILLLFAGCLDERPSRYEVSEPFQKYVDQFVMTANVFDTPLPNVALIIEFSELNEPILGRCFRERYLVRIDETSWPRLTEIAKTNLIFHELGHCLLQRRHNNELMPDGSYSSIMNYRLISDKMFNKNSEHYLTELFDSENYSH